MRDMCETFAPFGSAMGIHEGHRLQSTFAPVEEAQSTEKIREDEKERNHKLFESESIKNFNWLIYKGYDLAKYNEKLFTWNKDMQSCVMHICKDIEREIDCDARLNPNETLAVAIGVGYYLKEIGTKLNSKHPYEQDED